MQSTQLQQAFLAANADYTPAEAQAIACGLFVIDTAADKIQWVKLIFGDIEPDNTQQHEAIKLAGDLFEASKAQLQDSNLAFDLLLPEEDQALQSRVNAIQQWCAGFVLGVGLAGVSDYREFPEDSREIMADLSEIGKAGEFDLDNAEESEEAFAEIYEYVRMGVLLINEELQPLKQTSGVH